MLLYIEIIPSKLPITITSRNTFFLVKKFRLQSNEQIKLQLLYCQNFPQIPTEDMITNDSHLRESSIFTEDTQF